MLTGRLSALIAIALLSTVAGILAGAWWVGLALCVGFMVLYINIHTMLHLMANNQYMIFKLLDGDESIVKKHDV